MRSGVLTQKLQPVLHTKSGKDISFIDTARLSLCNGTSKIVDIQIVFGLLAQKSVSIAISPSI